MCRRFIEKWRGHPLIQPAVSPHAWYTTTPELLRACADLARGMNVPLHIHVSETKFEVDSCREANQMPVVPWLEKNGILNTKLLAAHCVHLDQGEMFSLKKAGAGAAHCPTSNLKLASGIAQVAKMVEIGVNVGIGTDGPASNNDLDMFEETRLASLLAKTATNDPTKLPAREALALATIGGAKAMHMGDITGSLEPGKRADVAVVRMDGVHNQPHFGHNPEAVYSRLVYAAKSTDVVHVVCNGRFLLRAGELLTVDEETAVSEAAQVAAQIDAFVQRREASPYNKLILLSGVERQKSFEVQIKVPIAEAQPIHDKLNSGEFEISKSSHYRQYDHYFLFDGNDPDAARLRYREDDYVDESGKVYQSRSRLTLIGKGERVEFPNAVTLSRSRYLAAADRSLRFYREYFAPANELEIQKDRFRWRLLYEGTDFAINLDQILQPELSGYYLEIKARTWSRSDAERKAELISELLQVLGVATDAAEKREYAEFAVRSGE